MRTYLYFLIVLSGLVVAGFAACGKAPGFAPVPERRHALETIPSQVYEETEREAEPSPEPTPVFTCECPREPSWAE